MDETPIPRPTRWYLLVVWTAAVAVGVLVGIGVVFLTQAVWVGLALGGASAAVVGISSVLAARRSAHGTFESAPPWTGDAGIRNHSGGPI
ncbi:hypothetical protein AAIB33_00635 [Microbacterium sp. AZCO]|uniref:hypothetical protein n=1 Tax=Microbacterium sp. AZCO TaxID=3142976 RepID=UPI0031F3D4CE